ncbi:hypothetical protein BQ8482_380209 [Mesorhizobium delmotii]|uniref:Uncharacterized protein n=1 Tax=Mesorhizobium delmotii TaxID=1631247 RepID=A0A2P9AS83_9HYPH|nr:hypothetical protein BQ8482_380209 [Mesorhizobium delmotii]
MLVCGLVLVTSVAIVPKLLGFGPSVGSRPLCAAALALDVIVVAVEMLDLEIAVVVERAFAKAGHQVGFRSISIGAVLIFPVPSSSPCDFAHTGF